ncbi:MAG: phospholipase D-like domain-containing protein [Candidatus Gastranaerophilaceae bacterium]
MKGFSITFLVLFFLVFLFYQTQKSADFQVLRIISPNKIVVDLNKNGVEDDDETILLENILTFSSKPNKAQNELAKSLKITEEDAMGLGFLAENFAKETLDGKKIKIQNSKITVNNKNYQKMLLNGGLALEKGKAPTQKFWQNLEKVRKLNLRIFNNKSQKYHKLNCKYGLLAHNSQILPASQIPKDAKPCKFCLVKTAKGKGERRKGKVIIDEIPYVKSPATIFQANSIKIFLTDFTKVLKPSNTCTTPVCKALAKEINSAQSSIDFAIYGYTKIPTLQKALENAEQRGVKVRFVYDLNENGSNIYPDTVYLSKVLKNNQHDIESQLMHDKFFIFDKKTVFTGSANISNTDMSGFNSNAVVLINSEKIADVYSREFEQMYSGKFHKQKLKIDSKADDMINIYFSPQDKSITEQIIPLIDNSQKYVYMPAFLITHKGLVQSLISASRRGVAVKLILDATNTHGNYSKLKVLRQNGIQVKTENLAGKLHSKSIIIDDLYTVIGSMNFSRSGETVNDENLIIIKNREIALFYKTFFQYLWKRIPDKWLKYNARAESPDSIGSCNDGIDNDFDGKIDKADDSCVARIKR